MLPDSKQMMMMTTMMVIYEPATVKLVMSFSLAHKATLNLSITADMDADFSSVPSSGLLRPDSTAHSAQSTCHTAGQLSFAFTQ